MIGEMWNMLEGMQELMTGNIGFDTELYDTLLECFDTFDIDLKEVSDANWAGIKEYANSNGSLANDDPWYPCPDELVILNKL